MTKIGAILFSLLFIIGCISKSQNDNKKMTSMKLPYQYLALGDSYTIGEAVEEDLRWPVQLSAQLTAGGISVESPRIIATTGWTTDELMNAIEEAKITESYDLVSLLIGVNNQYRGYPFEQYENRVHYTS